MPVQQINNVQVSLTNINFSLILFVVFGLGFLVFLLFIAAYIAFIVYKNRQREERSLKSVLLEVAVSQGNDIKIDAMEQFFSSLNSVKKGGWKQRFDIQPTISFELVARPEDIRFYVWTPKKLEDLIEKQIHGAYPQAEIKEVEEYKEIRIKQAEQLVNKIIQKASQEIFGRIITFNDHQNIMIESLERAKKEGVFD